LFNGMPSESRCAAGRRFDAFLVYSEFAALVDTAQTASVIIDPGKPPANRSCFSLPYPM
jgi:hypothetical protein